MKFIPCAECLLRQNPQFKQFTKPELGFVRALKTSQIDLPAGAIIIDPKADEWTLSTLYSGWAFRYRVSDGQRQILDILLPGSLIGLQELMLGSSESAVESLTPVTLCILGGQNLSGLFSRYENLMESMVATLMEDERRSDVRLELVAKRSGPERLAYFLLELFDRLVPLNMTERGWCHFPLQRRHLADLLGLSDTHVSRSMQELKQRQLASISARTLSILNRTAMTQFSGYEQTSEVAVRLLL